MHQALALMAGIIASISALFGIHPAATTATITEPSAEHGKPSAPAVAGAQSTDTVHIPIYTYHLIRPVRASDAADARPFIVSTANFEKQMAYLDEHGYVTISFKDLEDHFDHGTPLPAKAVILSFDDSWENQYENAYPSLKKHGLTATFFVNTGGLDDPGEHEHPNRLTWEQVEELSRAGMPIGNHTRTHQYLTKQTDEQLLREITGAGKAIAAHTGKPVDAIAFPFGDYDQRIIDYIKKDGYRAGRAFSFGIDHTADDRWALRIVRAPDSLESFVKYLPE